MKIKKHICSFYFKLFETCLIISTKFSTCNNKTLSNIVMAKVLITEKNDIWGNQRVGIAFWPKSTNYRPIELNAQLYRGNHTIFW